MNPTGVYVSLARREALARLAIEYGIPIVEDDPYGELRFEGERLPNLVELAPEQIEEGIKTLGILFKDSLPHTK